MSSTSFRPRRPGVDVLLPKQAQLGQRETFRSTRDGITSWEPIPRLLLTSIRFGIISRETVLTPRAARVREFLHQIRELCEQVVRIVRPGRCFRVILHAKERQRFVTHAL